MEVFLFGGGCYRVILESLLIIFKEFIKLVSKRKMLTSTGEVYMIDVNILDKRQIYIKKNLCSTLVKSTCFFQNAHFFNKINHYYPICVIIIGTVAPKISKTLVNIQRLLRFHILNINLPLDL